MNISRQEKIIAGLCITSLGILWFVFAYIQHTTYSYVIGDTAVAQNALYNTLRGDWFYQSALAAPHNFREHISLIQILYLPFLAVIPHTLILYCVIHVTYAITGFFLYVFTRQKMTRIVALTATALYITHPLTTAQTVGAFHVAAMAGPLILMTLLAYEAHKYRWFLAGIISLFLIPEFIAPTIALIGVIALLEKRTWRWWLPPILSGSLLYLLARQFVTIGNGSHGSIMQSLNPANWAQTSHLSQRFLYAIHALQPILWVPLLFTVRSLLLIPTLLIIGFIVQFERFSGSAHLFAAVPPLLAFVFIHIMSHTQQNIWQKKLTLTCAIIGITISLPLQMQWLNVNRDKPAEQYEEILPYIVDTGSVSVPAHIAPHLANRRELYLHLNREQADYIIITESASLRARTDDPIAVQLISYFDDIKASKSYREVITKDPVSLYITTKKIEELFPKEYDSTITQKELQALLQGERNKK